MLDCQPAVVCWGEAVGLWGELMGGNPPPVPVGVVGLLENPDPPAGRKETGNSELFFLWLLQFCSWSQHSGSLIYLFDLAQVFCRIPFLIQPSTIIHAWDQHWECTVTTGVGLLARNQPRLL